MRYLLVILFFAASFSVQAQTSKELVGKWKLVKETMDGKVTTPEDTYQVFKANGSFEGITPRDSMKAKWKLSDDGKKLTVKMKYGSVDFTVDYFDAKKRVITSKQTGTLEYVKVDD
ncbi:lipocalin-like domain-containing protein [Algoriphagus chordae]|uniref:Extracellular endo-alpha-(1->5)-L-arabinanase C-terminal domain-containing protein n=1 Tax=Algoriphagus chordae TaxID=237019 RepID=A0A2W7QJQ6_9BACT|nr:glycoside hydrolase family 43 C-terminal domain-containing protein [Algoriphagus chordae]PZX48704.1 hypothetical protein LV85_03519 [Algoriphagus chordae]